jgi:hypothetical protein
MIILKVPYAEKDQAKALGARWNNDRKAWYVPDGQATAPFERWITSQHDALSSAPRAKSAKLDTFSSKPVIGKHFLLLEHDCNPFDECAECAPVLAKAGWSEARSVLRQSLATMKSPRTS